MENLKVTDAIGYFSDEASMTWHVGQDDMVRWPIEDTGDLPLLTQAVIKLGIEDGDSPTDFGAFYVHRATGNVEQSGVSLQLSLTRASRTAQMESLLRYSWTQQLQSVLSLGSGAIEELVGHLREKIDSAQNYSALVRILGDYGLGVGFEPLTSTNNSSSGYASGNVNLVAAGWTGVPVPIMYPITDLFRLQAGESSGDAVELDDYPLRHGIADARRRADLIDNLGVVRVRVKSPDALQRSRVDQDGKDYLDEAEVEASLAAGPSVTRSDLFQPVLVSEDLPSPFVATARQIGEALKLTMAAEEVSVEPDFNPALRARGLVAHHGRVFRIISVTHDASRLSTALSCVPVS